MQINPNCVCSVDTKLIAAAQRSASARCHDAANLVQSYLFSAELCRQESRGRDVETISRARNLFGDNETKLRKFVYECRHPARAQRGSQRTAIAARYGDSHQ